MVTSSHTCARCEGRTFVCARCREAIPECEGADDEAPELCDDCWAIEHGELVAIERLPPEAFVP